jgi:hypothetical protein
MVWATRSDGGTTMKKAIYQDNGLPNHYGNDFIIIDAPQTHAIVIFRYSISAIFGILFDLLRIAFKKENHHHNSFKVKEPKSMQQAKLHQTVKYSAMLYLYMIVAMAAIPVGICSTSYQPITIAAPIIAPARQEPIALEAQTGSHPAQISEIPSDEQNKEAQNQANTPCEPPFFTHILRASKTYEVDTALIRAIIMAESSNNPRAVSRKGARGLMQLMPTTAKWLGVEDAFDPALNIDGGVRYFKRLLDRFDGDIELALAAYNAGSRYVRKYGGVPPFKATRIYIQKVLKYRQQFEKETISAEAGLTMS